MKRAHALSLSSSTLAALLLLPGCGDRDPVWDAAPVSIVAQGMTDALAIVDMTAERVVMLPVKHDLTLAPTSLPIQRGYASSATTPDGQRLLVLSHGDVPRTKATDQGPTL